MRMMWKFVAFITTFLAVRGQDSSESEARVVRWCVPYDQPPAYARVCTRELSAANTDEVEFQCVSGGSVTECFEMIQNGEAELTTVDGGDGYVAHTQYSIEPLLYENYGYAVGTEYYAVALVPREFCDNSTTLENLRGLRSCHTGYRKTAGWFMPLGTLLDQGVVEPVSEEETIEDDAETMRSFFDEICAPRVSGNGPMNGRNGEGESWEELCTTCGGDCTTHDKYYDYQGALRCLMENAGDVAFVKHTTLLDFARDGSEPKDWADKDIADFQLLCREGECRDPEDYEDCHLARVPAHSVVANASLTFGGSDFEFGERIQSALVDAVENNSEFLDSVTELEEQENFVFKSGTVELSPVRGTYETTVDEGALSAYNGVSELTQT
eukprot:g4435.t1